MINIFIVAKTNMFLKTSKKKKKRKKRERSELHDLTKITGDE